MPSNNWQISLTEFDCASMQPMSVTDSAEIGDCLLVPGPAKLWPGSELVRVLEPLSSKEHNDSESDGRSQD